MGTLRVLLRRARGAALVGMFCRAHPADVVLGVHGVGQLVLDDEGPAPVRLSGVAAL
ncbi:hypothetical protein [Streptomyces sp. NBC_00306]|uniref:hypothetical protein n=1 Tax=Streptomyces sp. NBC_00306 TaxID=2975708 RepID=UPI002E2BD839|nr:hypothetical protein [Streptomyces sp. NBC_00306]